MFICVRVRCYMDRFSVTDMSRQPGQVMKSAKKGGAIITSRGEPTAVIVDYETFVTMRLRDRILGDSLLTGVIERALGESKVSWKQVKQELNLDD